MSGISEICGYIQAAGLGVERVDIWAGFFPDEPDNIIVVEAYPGSGAQYVQESPLPNLELPRFQIRVRDNEYDAAQARIEAVYRVLGAVKNATIDGTWYTRLLPLQSPYKLDLDKNNRHHLAFNLEARKGLSA